MTEPRIITVTTTHRQKDGARISREVPYRLCDVADCQDRGSKYHFAGNRCFCAEHKHLAGEE
jgi:hypothetical protein